MDGKKTDHLIRKDFWFRHMKKKIQNFIGNCVKCILAEKKHGKGEGLLKPIDKGCVPLDTYHIDHLGPIPSTKKNYKHILVVVDAFTKFVWLYPSKSTSCNEVIAKLKLQATTFGNPKRIVSDRGSAFTSHTFKAYCEEEKIEHVLITTGVPRANGQVERINRILIPILTKLAMPKAEEWFKYVNTAQQFINSTYNRSIATTPFELLVGKAMNLKDDPEFRAVIDKELIDTYIQDRDTIRKNAVKQISKIQQENRTSYNKKRKQANQYKIGNLVAIKRMQRGPGLKMHTQFIGPYKVTKVLRNDRYLVEKLYDHEGPNKTSSAADFMKPWSTERSYEPSLFTDESDTDSENIEDDVNTRMAECRIAIQ